MRKLKLESLQVESFETTTLAPRMRGTVEARCDPQPTPSTISIETYHIDRCGDTQYFDCSLGCPSIAPCDETGPNCWAVVDP
jgi:hypothetical protein